MENQQDMPFQSEGGCDLNFFINVHYDFEALVLQLWFFLKFILNKLYRFWDSAFVAFNHSNWMRNEQDIIVISKGGLEIKFETKYHSFSSCVFYFVLLLLRFKNL